MSGGVSALTDGKLSSCVKKAAEELEAWMVGSTVLSCLLKATCRLIEAPAI